jgi:hypothetical protein
VAKRLSDRRRFRARRVSIAAVMLTVTASCTPGQIEGVFNQLATPFESGYDIQSLEAGLFQAALVLSYLIPGLSLGPFFP